MIKENEILIELKLISYKYIDLFISTLIRFSGFGWNLVGIFMTLIS